MKQIIKCDEKDIKKIIAEHFSVNESYVSISIEKETRGYYLSEETVPVVVAEIETDVDDSKPLKPITYNTSGITKADWYQLR